MEIICFIMGGLFIIFGLVFHGGSKGAGSGEVTFGVMVFILGAYIAYSHHKKADTK